MTRPTYRLPMALASVLLALAGCAQPGRPLRSASAGAPSPATSQACRAEVDRVYAAQNRADLSTRDERDTPFAANYLPGVTTQGLGARYSRGNMMSSCLDNASAGGRPSGPGAGVQGTAATGANPGSTFNPVAR